MFLSDAKGPMFDTPAGSGSPIRGVTEAADYLILKVITLLLQFTYKILLPIVCLQWL